MELLIKELLLRSFQYAASNTQLLIRSCLYEVTRMELLIRTYWRRVNDAADTELLIQSH